MGQIVNPVTLEKGLRAEFMKAYENGESPSEIMPVIMEIPTAAASEKYGWLGNVPQMVEWKDERQLKGLYESSYTISNSDYEATIQVDRNAIEDDQLGAVKIRINDLAVKAKLHPRKLFFDALVAGTTDLCYDGQAFFSNSHSEGVSGTQDNLLAGTGTTVAQLSTDLNSAIAAIMGFKDDKGEPFNEGAMDLYVVMPPALQGAFREILNAQMISSTTNVLSGIAKPIVSSRLTDANDWYVLNGSGVVKPMIMQVRKKVEFSSLEANSDMGFMKKTFAYGVDHRMGFGYGLWQKAIKIVNA